MSTVRCSGLSRSAEPLPMAHPPTMRTSQTVWTWTACRSYLTTLSRWGRVPPNQVYIPPEVIEFVTTEVGDLNVRCRIV